MPPSDLEAIKNLPPLVLDGYPNAEENTEIKALEAAGAVKPAGNKVYVPDPGKVPYLLMTLDIRESVWLAFSKRRNQEGLYEEVIQPTRQRLKRVIRRFGDPFWLYCSGGTSVQTGS